MLFWPVFLLGLSAALGYDHQIYQGYRILQTVPTTAYQVEALARYADEQGIDIWTGPKRGITNEIFVSPEKFGATKSFLYRHAMTFTISDRNVAEELKVDWQRLSQRRDYDINDYNTYEDINTELVRLSGLCAGQGLTCSTTNIGQSLEGRDTWSISVSSGQGTRLQVIDSTIHAREWLATATVMRILDELITGYGTNPEATALLNDNDFVITPILNPDGYTFTWTNERLWRKNRRVNEGSSCMGVDLNRNFDWNWGDTGGGSGNPCSETYFGTAAESEPESQNYVAYLNSLSDTKDILLHVHTSGYYWLAPYGDGSYPAEWTTLWQPAMSRTCTAIENTHGTNWQCGNTADVLYEVSGGLADWALDFSGFRLSFVPELRNDGFGFAPPPSSIQPSFEEIWNGVYALIMDP